VRRPWRRIDAAFTERLGALAQETSSPRESGVRVLH
jgi:hypothetical protein